MSEEVAAVATGAPKPPPDPFYTLRPHAGDVTAVKYLNLGSNGGIVSGTGSGQLSLWNLSTKRQMWTEVCPASVIAISSVTSDTLAVQLSRGTVTLWSLEAHKQMSSFSIQNPGFCRLSLFPPHVVSSSAMLNPNCFAVADSNWGKANIYDSSTQTLVQTLSVKDPKSRGMCMCVQTHCSQSAAIPCVLGGFDDGSVILWDCRQPSTELTSLKLFPDPVMCMSFNAESQSGVCGSPTNTLEVFTLSTEQTLFQKYSVELRNSGVGDVSIRQDNKIMASGGWDGRIRVFGWKKGKPLAILNYHSAAVHCVSFAGPSALSVHANLLICGSKDERISLWTLY